MATAKEQLKKPKKPMKMPGNGKKKGC